MRQGHKTFLVWIMLIFAFVVVWQFLNSQQISFTEQDLNGISDWLKANIKADIFTTQFGQEQGLRVRADWDPMISQAISYLPQAQALEDQAKKADEQRASAALHTDQ